MSGYAVAWTLLILFGIANIAGYAFIYTRGSGGSTASCNGLAAGKWRALLTERGELMGRVYRRFTKEFEVEG